MMKLVQLNEAICRWMLEPGQVRRVPMNVDKPLFGYYIACPLCRRSNALLVLDAHIVEVAGRLTATEFPCDGCHERIAIRDGEFVA